MPFQQGDAAVDQQVAVDAIEALDLAGLVGDQGRPVELHALDRPAEAARLLQLVGDVGAIDQQLLRHTADVHAGAAQIAALRHGHSGTETGGKPRRTYAAGTGANHKQVEIECHVGLLAMCGKHITRPNKTAPYR